MTATPGPLFALALASISLIGPLAVHLFMPVIPAVKVLAKVSRLNQSASSPVTCRGSKLSTPKRAINVINSSCSGLDGHPDDTRPSAARPAGLGSRSW